MAFTVNIKDSLKLGVAPTSRIIVRIVPVGVVRAIVVVVVV
jgi:hypothetical protein